MNELHEWLEAHRIAYRPIDREVVEIEGLGKLFLADLSGVESIFRVRGAEVEFNLMERPEVLLAEGIEYVAFPFGDNWYYYSLREGFGLNILKYVGRRVPCKRKTPFVNLGVHTPYELLNASGDVSQWVRKAVWMGHSALGICDRNTMGATLALQKACDKAGIRPVIGYTCTLAHEGEKVEVKIYCQSQRGLRNLLRSQKAVMVDAADATVPLPELLRRGEGNVLVFGKLSPYWMEKNLHAVKALRETFDNVFYQVDLSEYKAERLDAEVLKAIAHFFHTFYDEKNDSFLVEPILIRRLLLSGQGRCPHENRAQQNRHGCRPCPERRPILQGHRRALYRRPCAFRRRAVGHGRALRADVPPYGGDCRGYRSPLPDRAELHASLRHDGEGTAALRRPLRHVPATVGGGFPTARAP